MDPFTAGLTLANSVLLLATKIWDSMSPEMRTLRADDFAKTAHNCSSFLQSVQDKINAAVK